MTLVYRCYLGGGRATQTASTHGGERWFRRYEAVSGRLTPWLEFDPAAELSTEFVAKIDPDNPPESFEYNGRTYRRMRGAVRLPGAKP